MKIFDCGGICRRKDKTRLSSWLRGLDPAIKWRLFMRINFVAFFLLFTIMHVSVSVHAQKITLSIDKAPLKTVFKEIEKQSGFEVWYNNNLLKDTKPVTVKMSGDLKSVLDKVFTDQPLTYEIVDKTIVIKRKPVSVVEKITKFIKAIKITGTVTDEKGNPLVGVTVRLKGTSTTTVTGRDGKYMIDVPDENAVLLFSYVGFQTIEQSVGDKSSINTTLKETISKLEEFEIVSTGYQNIPKERVTGSFVQLDSALVQRRVSTNILDRVDGISSGVLFNGEANKSINTNGYFPRNSGFNIRGQSTINASSDPLIVLDNFPYEGEISNINPNDIESITILKDAAAASIWGASAGNGVVVITTKKGKLNQRTNVELNTNLTIGNKPDLKYDRNFLNAKDYIGVESYLFEQGYFDDDLSNNSSFPALSPVVSILAKQRAGDITADAAKVQLDMMGTMDVRDDIGKYIYQKSINQQYALGIRGGTKDLSYSFSVGRDDNRDNLVRNTYDRTTINSTNTYTALKNLELTVGLNYSQNTTRLNNQFGYGATDSYDMFNFKYNSVLPYARLADGNGMALAIPRNYSQEYIDQTQLKGFLDWNYRPLDELNNADNSIRVKDLLLRFSAKYRIIPQITAELQYQNEHQTVNTRNYQGESTYYARNLINQFSVFDEATGTFNYILPKGGILNLANDVWNSNNFRGQFNYNQAFRKHDISAIAGAEVRERKTEGFNRLTYGYDDRFGSGVGALNYNIAYDINPSGSAFIPAPTTDVFGSLYRYISYYANAAYTYDQRYIFSISGRRDGSNIFGVKTNDKITPLWSTGIGWNINREDFYYVAWLPQLKLRATYGYNGNVYQGSAYLTGFYSTDNITGAKLIAITNAPNPELRWERVKNINLGLDFSTKGNRVSGTVEYFWKNGLDLLQPTPLPSQTGFSTYMANTATTKANGLDLSLNSQNFKGAFLWNSTFLFSTLHDKLIRYDVPQTSSSFRTNGGFSGIVGKPLFSIYSYKWAGLDPENGDPQGFLNGKVSKDYNAIIRNFSPDSLVYNGSYRPTVFGAIRNDFSYKGISLSVNITYKFGYVFRRSSISTDYTNVLTYFANTDFGLRWQNPGDEQKTNVPSLRYPEDNNRSSFYTYSETLVESGSHVRLQDIRLGYDIPLNNLLRRNFFSRLQVYGYASNLGIIWRKNKYGIDPDAFGYRVTHTLPNPFSISFGVNANF
ncbi:SusC/RagA family TonB-linked outer membrane protein [Pedobacter sp. B4-66]|uniref:SusC/RagA family TonB-linked outer membrane protein n=1 Tax=Pedobacter sp. B4-66 TaxID=2817280 RepID=UPI0020245C39|nr:SusC/RagA family TonB-linked outer membrane protein [Pedobacter sp. B4-66]